MAWVHLILAGLFEVGFTTCLVMAENTDGKTKMGWYVAFIISLSLSMYFLISAARIIPMGTAYAVFTGIVAVGTALMGILFFQEYAGFWRLFFMAILIGSIVGLNLVSTGKA